MYVVHCSKYESIVGRHIDGRVRIKEDALRSVAADTKKCYSKQVFITSDFLSKD